MKKIMKRKFNWYALCPWVPIIGIVLTIIFLKRKTGIDNLAVSLSSAVIQGLSMATLITFLSKL